VFQLFLGELLMRHVTRVDDDRPHGRVVQQVAPVRFDESPRAVGVAEAGGDRLRQQRLAPRALHHAAHLQDVVGVREVRRRPADHLLGPQAEHALDGAAYVDDDAGFVDSE